MGENWVKIKNDIKINVQTITNEPRGSSVIAYPITSDLFPRIALIMYSWVLARFHTWGLLSDEG